ncbi:MULTISPECIES: hypothetical protein [Streptomyces]|uniref:Putative membrane protein n=1 Tax=Streptomyces glaucescens TaxID=1907 RepID=A0A089XF23_STRGA|nr:hypothetical protein [Streptomyces glaucescens]AIS02583.1 putative membrane protein [Streptomyces glaucescens]
MGRRNNRPDARRSGWRRIKEVCVIVTASMTATYWTLSAVQAAIDLHTTVAPW